MTNQQGVPEALRLADALECRTTSWPDKVFAAAALRRLHAENVRLQQGLIRESRRTAEQKLRADQMTRQLADQADSQPAPVLDCDRIREIFMAHGFTVEEGQTDLKQYVYDAADALLCAARAPAADSVLEDAARLKALHAAVTAIYLDGGSDFKSALGAVVRHLDPKLAGDLLAWPKRAYDISLARLDAARKQGANHD